VTALAVSPTALDGNVVTLGVDDPQSTDLAVVGGKGAALGEMIRAGFPTPPAVVVSTDAYELAARNVSRGRPGWTIDPPPDDDIDEMFHGSAPPDLGETILDARHRIAPGRLVAVRSSATTEDLGGASYAGQYRSVIGVETDDEVIDAVELVWASLWHRAPRIYRALRSPNTEAAMAVIIQPMVPATSAGVVFTVDPAGERERIRVEAVDGLGESLVSGERTPDVFVLDRHVPEVSGRPDASEAARWALRCEALFGEPQDVEWAWADGQLWVVQSRPITTAATAEEIADGFDSRVEDDRRYTTAGIAEMLPGVLPALSWNTAGLMVDHAFGCVIDQLDGLPTELADQRAFLVRVRGRVALDLDHLTAIADRLPGGSPDDVEHQFFGTTVDHPSTSSAAAESAPTRWSQARHDVRVLRANRIARHEQALTQRAITELVSERFDLAVLSDQELLALRARLVDLGMRATAAELGVAAAAVAAFRRLEDRLQKYLGESPGTAWAMRVTRGLRPVALVRDVDSIATEIDARAPRTWRHPIWPAAREEMEHDGLGDLVVEARDAARRAGSRSVPGGVNWDEDMNAYWRMIRAAGTSRRDRRPRDDDLRELERELIGLPGWTRTRVLTGQIVDTRRYIVRRLARDAVDLLERREASKAALMTVGGIIRRVDLEAGRRLVDRRLLVHALDVDNLTPRELRAALAGEDAVDADVVLARRRAIERWRAEDDLPLTFRGHPSATETVIPSGDRLAGWAASAGRHTGPVRFLTEPDDASVQPGDVVVARRTDASWSPVFLRAAAIVVEEGGPLSHAGIVARELGLPAVVNVPGAVARLRHETSPVTVDGDAGVVVVHDDTREGVAT